MDSTNTPNNGSQNATQTEDNPFASTLKAGIDKLFSGMKMSIASLIISFMIILGCKTIPTTEQIGNSSRLIGTSTGLVVNAMGVDDDSKTRIMGMLNTACSTIPASNETFVAVWVPLAKIEIDRLVVAGAMDATEGDITLTIFTVVCRGIDYIFEVRYPKAKVYRELVEAAVDGFTQGFGSVVKPYALKSGPFEIDYDTEAYEYLKASVQQ